METIKYIKSLSFGDWFFTYVLTLIPIVGLIMLFVWAFGSSTQENKRNWAKAMLIIYAIAIAIAVIATILLGAVLGGLIMEIFDAVGSANGL